MRQTVASSTAGIVLRILLAAFLVSGSLSFAAPVWGDEADAQGQSEASDAHGAVAQDDAVVVDVEGIEPGNSADASGNGDTGRENDESTDGSPVPPKDDTSAVPNAVEQDVDADSGENATDDGGQPPVQTDETDTSLLSPLADNDASVINVLSDAGGNYATRKAAIEAQWRAVVNGTFRGSTRYSTQPSTAAPYAAGALQAAYIQDGLRSLNFVRYLAGLPNDVTHDGSYGSLTQTAAVLLAASEFSHTPAKPGNMSQEFYERGYSGTSRSNLAWGYSNLRSAIIDGWAKDSDSSNIAALGHRRWVLNPAMAKTGFGDAASRYVMYAFDHSRAQSVDYEAIAYPSGKAFPANVINGTTAWSITLNPALYRTPQLNEITVSLSNGTRTWNFSSANTSTNGRYFNVETSGYGVSNCIIFRPDNVSAYTGTYTVTVNGIKTRAGSPATLRYQVGFFTPDITPPTLSAGSAVRTSATAATVRFTSNEAGRYYHAVVASGAAAPSVNSSGSGAAMSATVQSFVISNLASAAARDVYIVGKDASGNTSARFKISIPAHIPDPKLNGVIATIAAASNRSRVLDIPGQSTRADISPILWDSKYTPNQRFRLISDGQGYYFIQNIRSGLVLDVSGGQAKDKAVILQYTRHDGDNQRWRFIPNANGSYTIVSKVDENYCLDLPGGSTARDIKPILYTRGAGKPNQQFYLDAPSSASLGGVHTITSALPSDRFIDISGASRQNGARAILWSKNKNDNQRFRFVYNADTGYYAIVSVHSNRALDVEGASTKQGASVIQWTAHKGYNQQWCLVSVGGGRHAIYSASSGMALDVHGGSSASGAPLIVWPWHGGSNQRWTVGS
jgi:uncharacterized protein YkwD